MKAFSVSASQAASICAGLIVEELANNFGRHVDHSTATGWSAETPLREGGVELGESELAACLARIERFAGMGAPLPEEAGQTIGALANAAANAMRERLLSFAFAPAGRESAASVHAADLVYADAAAAATLLYGRRRILSLVAPHGLMGFALTVLTPNLLQVPSVDARMMSPDELQKLLAFGDALVATPSLWRYIVAQGLSAPDNAMAIFFGEPMSAELSTEIRKIGFGAQREVYGSTEHGLIGWRDSASDPFALFDHWKRVGDLIERATPSGEKSPTAPMDIFQWEGERRFKLGGRRDGAVQIGAVNVFPQRIAALIAEHPAVVACEIEVSRHAAGADRIIASIVLNGRPSESTARSIDAWCRQKLRPHERPRVYNYDAQSK